MKNTYGNNLTLSVFGGSHDAEIGMRLSGFPAGMKVDFEALHALMARRAPGSTPLGTPRRERDLPVFQTGLDEQGVTTGGEIIAVIRNENARSLDYSFVYDTPRPGHADYAALKKYGNGVDLRGGGHFSGRLTAPLCIAGGLCLQYLKEKGIRVGAHIASINGVFDTPFDPVFENTALFDTLAARPLAVIDEQKGAQMTAEIEAARAEGDSVGGTVECMITGLPVGLGEHMFDGTEGRLSAALFGIPAVKGVEFGAGFGAATLRGSENNDVYVTDGKHVRTETNHAGGILGGMTSGMPVVFRIAIKPTPSIAKEQRTVSLSKMENTTLTIGGRHDPCILPRVVPVVEAVTAITITDLLLDKSANGVENRPLDLGLLRQEIDRIDRELVPLFAARMRVSSDVAEYKRGVGMAVSDPVREAALLERVAAASPAETADYARTLYTNILSLSRAYQHARLGANSPLSQDIKSAIAQTPTAFPTHATVACQGTAGAYSHKAARVLFEAPQVRHYAKFADVFAAIERGECRYGILPIENSTAGSVTEIYDLMSRHRFFVVRAVKLDVEHCLLGKRGAKMEDITEIVSHSQALAQCAAFLAKYPHVKLTSMENTAVAARYAAECDGTVAALADRECAALYGLDVLNEGVCDAKHNRTRFICISKSLEIYEGADKTSLILTLPHKPGSLSRLLARFDALRINLTKLESRPCPERDFEFRFYFDLVSPAGSEALLSLLAELAGEHEAFRYLGTYSEL